MKGKEKGGEDASRVSLRFQNSCLDKGDTILYHML